MGRPRLEVLVRLSSLQKCASAVCAVAGGSAPVEAFTAEFVLRPLGKGEVCSS